MDRQKVSAFLGRHGLARSKRLERVRACSTETSGSTAEVKPERTILASLPELETDRKLRVLSGVQPTGTLHLGNYLGAVQQWVKNQDKFDNFFTIVDLHAITLPHDPKALRESSMTTAALYLACGLDPKTSSIFLQSHVPAHAELTWLLNCATPIGWLERMVQYKEKARKAGENVSVGLLDYPVLMAADILLYQADLVPVGDDQNQHLELARNIRGRFKNLYDKRGKRRVFKEPKTLLQKDVARVMALDDGTKKMSKSDESDNSRINLLDPPEVIARKIKRCKTDSIAGLQFDNPERPECNNLLTIYQGVTGIPKENVAADFADSNFGTIKKVLTEAIVDELTPIQKTYGELMDDQTYLKQVLRDGAEKANSVASDTLARAQSAMGFVTLDDIAE